MSKDVTTKRIEDYLHLYLGCEVMEEWSAKAANSGVQIKLTLEFLIVWLHDLRHEKFHNHKPILRPLSDMSEEEYKECDLKTHPKFWMTDSSIWCFTAEKTKYLLSKHFDLFGLIEAGLAIDKTTLK